MNPEIPLNLYLNAAKEMVAQTRAYILQVQEQDLHTRLKADDSYLTDVDLAVEQILRQQISERFPNHGILGEEFDTVNPDADFQWIIDPIDGTLSFTRGIPLYGTILALHHQGQPLVGIIDHPALGRCYSAAVGLGAFCNEKRLPSLQMDKPIEREIISLCDRSQFIKAKQEALFDAVIQQYSSARIYTDCFGHTMATQGSIGAAVDFGLRLWDLAATQVLIEEVGGKYVCIPDPAGNYFGVICGKPAIVDQLLPLVALNNRGI